MRNRVIVRGVNALGRSASHTDARRNIHTKKGAKGKKKVEKKQSSN